MGPKFIHFFQKKYMRTAHFKIANIIFLSKKNNIPNNDKDEEGDGDNIVNDGEGEDDNNNNNNNDEDDMKDAQG